MNHVSKKESFTSRYRQGNIPWDKDKPDTNLMKVIRDYGIKACKALDIGCGTGANVIWLAGEGFDAYGVDFVPQAIEQAKEKAEKQQVSCHFSTMDFVSDKVEENAFGFVLDRGCFHSIPDKNKDGFIENVFKILNQGGLWLSLMGNCDQPKFDSGPPRLNARQITKLVEPHFEILLLKSDIFNHEDENPNRSWVCLLKKREI